VLLLLLLFSCLLPILRVFCFVTVSEEGWFNLMLVQHTQQIIIMPHKKVGEKVNLEVDVAGKYAAAASQVIFF
jgi:riboflavin synthase alpha subunit